MKRSIEAPYSGFCCVSLACSAVTLGEVSDAGAALVVLRRGGGGERRARESRDFGCRSLAFIRARVRQSRSSSKNVVPRPGYWIVPSSGAMNLTCNHATSTTHFNTTHDTQQMYEYIHLACTPQRHNKFLMRCSVEVSKEQRGSFKLALRTSKRLQRETDLSDNLATYSRHWLKSHMQRLSVTQSHTSQYYHCSCCCFLYPRYIGSAALPLCSV